MEIKDSITMLLKADGLSLAEEITGKSYKEDETTGNIGLLIHINKNRILSNLMDITNDTKFSETEPGYLKKVTDFGFETLLIEPFTTKDGREERLYIMFHPEYSILLKWDTFTWGDDGSWAKEGKEVPLPSRNGGEFYYNWAPTARCLRGDFTSSGSCIRFSCNKQFKEQTYHIPEPIWDNESWEEFNLIKDEWFIGYNAWIEENNLQIVWEGYHDCREAMKHNINNMAENGMFLKQWLKHPNLYLNHHSIDYEGIDDYNKYILDKLPKHIQKIICYEK